MREIAENASSWANRTAGGAWRRRIAASALIVGAFFSEAASQTGAFAQNMSTAQSRTDVASPDASEEVAPVEENGGDGWCSDCVHCHNAHEEIGICRCTHRRKPLQEVT